MRRGVDIDGICMVVWILHQLHLVIMRIMAMTAMMVMVIMRIMAMTPMVVMVMLMVMAAPLT